MRRILMMLLVCMMFAPAIADGAEANVYQMKQIDEVTNQWEIHIDYPEFTGLVDARFQEKLNVLIKETVDKQVKQMKQEAEEAKFPVQLYAETKVLQHNNFYSTLITFSKSFGNTFSGDIQSFNFYNQEGAKLIPLTDIIDLNKLTEQVREEMQKEPSKYFIEEFKGVRPGTAYYMQDGELVLIFNKYEIAAGVYGNPEIKIPLKHRY
ncbi:DUF3298 and DUF4163 domain-containing protein [Thalassobacillus hwangdonensis]|uniref:DUF3298 domain-containing protein n=1 Tax=Thalassobacillus hwangdonensis TaxID=546108 RepID=A0ABW3L5A2_9BACI